MPLSLRFRHVVFPAELGRRKRPINFAALPEADHIVADAAANLSAEQGAFVQWLFGHFGLDARQYRAETLQRRLPACLRALQVRSIAQARHLLESSPGSLPLALNTLVIGVTSFFRDPPVFELLRSRILPEVAQARGGVQVWSCGCSDGAELYSLAILLAEQDLLPQSYLLGTDCRPEAIERARLGCFDSSAENFDKLLANS